MRISEIYRIPDSDVDERYIRAKIRDYHGRTRGQRTLFTTIDGVRITRGVDDKGREIFLFAEDNTLRGMALLEPNTVQGLKGHYVTEIGLLAELRGRGLGGRFYDHLLDQGYTLFSGHQQTTDGQRMWQRLMNRPDVELLVVTSRTLKPYGEPGAPDPWKRATGVLVARKRGDSAGGPAKSQPH